MSVVSPPGPGAEARRAPALRVAAAMLAAEGVAAAAYGVFEATQIDTRRLAVGLGATILLIGFGVVLVLLGRGLVQARRWSRGPVVATQLIQLPIAWSFREGATWPVAALLGASALVALVCVFVPSSTAALVGDNPVPIGGFDQREDPSEKQGADRAEKQGENQDEDQDERRDDRRGDRRGDGGIRRRGR